jgi:hypothetical protein
MPRAGVDCPRTFAQFQDWFNSDEACFEAALRKSALPPLLARSSGEWFKRGRPQNR